MKKEEKKEEDVVVKLDTKRVLDALSLIHTPDKFAFFEELRIGGGFGKDSEQRFDAYAICYLPSKKNVTKCYEIKVSRSDFNAEMKKPLKRKAGLRLSNEFYFVTPKGLLTVEEIPPECGLMEVDSAGNVATVVPAPFRDIFPPTWGFIASICRRKDYLRKDLFDAILNEDGELVAYKHATLGVLKRHIEKWSNWRDGSKEIPDMFVRELKDIYEDVVDAVEANLKIK